MLIWQLRDKFPPSDKLTHQERPLLTLEEFNLVKEKIFKFEIIVDKIKCPVGLNSSPKRKKPSATSNLLPIPSSAEGPAVFLSPAQTPTGDVNNQYSVINSSEALAVPHASDCEDVTPMGVGNLNSGARDTNLIKFLYNPCS